MNNPQEILSLMPRDVIADEHNNQYVVVAHLVDRLVVQHTCVVSPNNAGKWTRCIPPTEATIPRRGYPPLFIMQRDLFAAGYLKVEGHTGSFWKSSPGTVEFTFSSINQAFDHMKDSPAPTFKRPLESARTPRYPSLPEMRNALKSAGWTLLPGARVRWQCPVGIPYGNTHFSYRVMKSWDAPR